MLRGRLPLGLGGEVYLFNSFIRSSVNIRLSMLSIRGWGILLNAVIHVRLYGCLVGE